MSLGIYINKKSIEYFITFNYNLYNIVLKQNFQYLYYFIIILSKKIIFHVLKIITSLKYIYFIFSKACFEFRICIGKTIKFAFTKNIRGNFILCIHKFKWGL